MGFLAPCGGHRAVHHRALSGVGPGVFSSRRGHAQRRSRWELLRLAVLALARPERAPGGELHLAERRARTRSPSRRPATDTSAPATLRVRLPPEPSTLHCENASRL